MAVLKEKGMKVPDVEMAKQWKEEIDRVNNLEFISVNIGRPIPDILFNPATPTYVVRVVLSDKEHQDDPRYFWISWDGIDREISRLIWFVSL